MEEYIGSCYYTGLMREFRRKVRTIQLHLEGKEHRTLSVKLARMAQMKKLSAMYYFC